MVQPDGLEEINHAGWGLADPVIAGRAHLAERSVEDHQRLVAPSVRRREDRVESGLAGERGHLLAEGVVVAGEIRLVQLEPITHNGIGQIQNVEGLTARRADTTANLEWVHSLGREVAEYSAHAACSRFEAYQTPGSPCRWYRPSVVACTAHDTRSRPVGPWCQNLPVSLQHGAARTAAPLGGVTRRRPR